MQTEVRRPLSPAERWFWVADQLSPFNVIARVRLTGHLPDGVLERAAIGLAAEHPLLRVAIRADADGTHPVFTRSSGGIAVRTVHDDGASWGHYVDEYELRTPMNRREGPLVRIVDITSDASEETHDLVLTASHVIADGTTVLTLLGRLIEHAAGRARGVTPRAVVGAPEHRLPQRHRGVRGVARLAAIGVADGLGAALARPCRLAPESNVDPTQRRTRLVQHGLTATQLDDLTHRCRREGVTVHGALAAAMALAIGPVAAQRASGRICIGSPIDFRSELDPPVSTDEAGSYVNTVPSIVRFDRDLWPVARRINRSLRRRKRSGQHLTLL